MSFDNLERCPYCKRFMTPEQAKKHVCNSPLVDVKEIDVLYFSETHDDKQGTVIMARGLDGVLYILRQHKKIVSDGFLQRKKSDEDFTEPCALKSAHPSLFKQHKIE